MTTSNFARLQEYIIRNRLKTPAQGVDRILYEHFLAEDNQKMVADRLNKVIQDYQNKVNNLESELRHKEVKENVKVL